MAYHSLEVESEALAFVKYPSLLQHAAGFTEL